MKSIIYIMTIIHQIVAIFGPLWLAKKYPIQGTPYKVRLVVFVMFFGLALYTAMLPIDIYNGMNDNDQMFSKEIIELNTLEYWTMVVLWRTFYGMLITGAVFYIPWLLADQQSGIVDDDERRKKAIRYLTIEYSIYGGIGLVFLGYLLVDGHLKIENVKQFCIALTNLYGLIYITFLLGYGLVYLPRRAFTLSRIDWSQRYFYYNIGNTIQEWLKTRTGIREGLISLYEFRDTVLNKDLENKEDLERRVNYMLQNIAVEHHDDAIQEYQMRLEKKRNIDDSQVIKDVNLDETHLWVSQKQIENLQELRDVYALLKTSIVTNDELKCASIFQTKEAIELEEIVNCIHKKNQGLDQSEYSKIIYRPWIFKKFVALEIFYYKRLRVLLHLLMVIIFSGYSTLVFIALTVTLYDGDSIVLLLQNYVAQIKYLGYFYYFFLLESFILYFVYLVMASLFAFRVNGFPGLWPEAASSYSLLNCSIAVGTIASPMCFYIIKIVFTGKKDYQEHTAFFGAYGDLTVIPILGLEIPFYLPAVLVILICLNIIGVYGRLLRWFGSSVYLFNVDFYSDFVGKGKKNVYTFKVRVKQHQALYTNQEVMTTLLTSPNCHLGLFIPDRKQIRSNIFSKTIDKFKNKNNQISEKK